MRKQMRRRRRMGWVLAPLLLLLLGVGAFLIIRYRPSSEHMSLASYYNLQKNEDGAVIANGKLISTDNDAAAAKRMNGVSYIRWSVLHDNIDSGWVYDSSEGILRYATDQSLISVEMNSNNYLEDRNQKSWTAPIVLAADQKTYVALDFVKQYSDLTYESSEEPNRYAIWTAGSSFKKGTLTGDEAVRRRAGVKSPILEDGKKGESVTIVQELDGWYQVVTAEQVIGCVRRNRVGDITENPVAASLPERSYSHRFLDQKVQLAWHQMTSTAGNSGLGNVLANTRGINVVSPTWFSLRDNQGNINDISSSSYVSTAHSQNIYVWGLVSNLVNQRVDTAAVLNHTSSRDRLTNQLIAAAVRLNLDGINVDIESLSKEAEDGYIQFIRELSLKAHANNLVVSVDNYVPSASSAHYNRREQGKFADYNVIMAYDEHWATDTTAGSNSSISFVRKAVADTLDSLPANQIILALPLYTRAWTTRSDGSVSSQVVMMKDQDNLLQQNGATAQWNEELGQSTAQWTNSEGNQVQIWLENSDSMAKKLEVYKNNQLAGLAFWKLGMEPASIWQTISAGK